TGVAIWNVTDVFNASRVSTLSLPGLDCNDYNAAAWWTFWQAPYIYVAAIDKGLFVVNASNLSAPQLVKNVSTTSLRGFNIGQVFAVGNQMVVTANNNDSGMATVDISDPANPVKIASTK